MGSIYFVQESFGGLVKIGWTSGRVRRRLSAIKTYCPHPVAVLGLLSNRTKAGELRLHKRFGKAHVRGEWFDPKKCRRLATFLQTLTPPPPLPFQIVESKEKAKRRRARRRQGFALMSATKRRKVSRLGGKTAHKRGGAHRFTSEQATAAVQKRWKNWEKKLRSGS